MENLFAGDWEQEWIRERGMKVAEENLEEIMKAVEGTDLMFLTAGLGGGTGSGATNRR